MRKAQLRPVQYSTQMGCHETVKTKLIWNIFRNSLLSISVLMAFLLNEAFVGYAYADGQPVFINEIHYDNAGTDQYEGIEIAGPAGTNLTGWKIYLYSGSDGKFYSPTTDISGTIPDQGNGFGTLWFDIAGIQNDEDGVALVDDTNTVVQFLSYEGSLTAVDGPASGMTSTDIGVSEDWETPVGYSLQLQGTGDDYSDFSWAGPIAHTRGAINTGQNEDTTPDAFSFIDQTDMPLGIPVISNPVTVTGISNPAPVSITGDSGSQYRINGGSWTDAGGTVSLDDVVEVRVTSSAANETTTSATLTIGGVSDTFSVTTAAANDPNASGLVALWKAEDNSYDSVGGNHGTAQGGLTYAAGQDGQAYSFNGTDAYVDIAITSSLDFGTDDFTISFWMNLNALTQQTLVHKSVGDVLAGTNQTYFVEYDSDASALRFRTSDPSVVNDLMAPFSFTTGEWYHITAVRSGFTNILYVNGVAIDSQTAGGLADTGSGGYFRIGQIAPNGIAGVERYVNGKLDEIKLYSRALSVGEVNMLGGTKPDAFSFTAQADAALGSVATSNTITVSGISNPAGISIVNGTYSINSGSYTADAGMVSNGDTVTVQQTASGSYSTMTTATLTIGGVSGDFNVTTIAEPAKITVTFDANGGTAPDPATKEVTYNATYGALATTTRAGYTFNGWFTQATGGTEVTSGTTVTNPADHTLYAQWTANGYTVTFNANGGTAPDPATKQVTYDATYGPLATTTRDGYTFGGWFTQATGGSEVTSGTTVTTASNHTLYAQWTANLYTVTFDANGGTAPDPATKEVTYYANYGALATTTLPGYTFNGWFTQATGGTQVTSGTTVTTASNHTLYAQWTEISTYSVNYDANEATSGSVPVDLNSPYYSGEQVTVLDNTGDLERYGFKFNDWNTAADGSGTQYAPDDIFLMPDENITLYAQWALRPAIQPGVLMLLLSD